MAAPNVLYRNEGDGSFVDVTTPAGVQEVVPSHGFGVVWSDFDRDGLQDLIVANDYGRNAFLRNLGSGRFENLAPALGLNQAYHSM